MRMMPARGWRHGPLRDEAKLRAVLPARRYRDSLPAAARRTYDLLLGKAGGQARPGDLAARFHAGIVSEA
ncbi:hypothetical protein [Nonomuraea dietziae]|uniref:hypothetical protein n=1 Tax=Nonomuraea dietziae TaxID=65515 RepID=UPI0033F3BD00